MLLDQDLSCGLNITACLSDCLQVLIEISELQHVEKLKVFSLLRVLDFLDLLHVRVDHGLILLAVQQEVVGLLYVALGLIESSNVCV